MSTEKNEYESLQDLHAKLGEQIHQLNLLKAKQETEVLSNEKMFTAKEVHSIFNALDLGDLVSDACNDAKDNLVEIEDVEFRLCGNEIHWHNVDTSLCSGSLRDVGSEVEDAFSEALEDKIRDIRENRDFAKNFKDADYRICFPGGEWLVDKQEFDSFSSLNEGVNKVLKSVQEACHSKTLGKSNDLKVYFYCEDDFGGAEWVRFYAFIDDLGVVVEKDELAVFTAYPESHLNKNSFDIALRKYNAEKEGGQDA